MSTQTSASNATQNMTPYVHDHIHHSPFRFRTVSIYSSPVDVAAAITLLNDHGFSPDQISLLGREQEGWQEKLHLDWELAHTAKGAAVGAGLGLLPGVVLVTGVAMSGGMGLLAAGPMIAALEALGMGALGGGLIGGAVSNLDSTQNHAHIREEIEDAIGRGHWVLVVHTHDESEARKVQMLLPDSRIMQDHD